ncbi:hypothetical protein BC826DRAFT_1108083 [Russula brevipes]|nr:hypothetical protein BC826DRAFT_1108083 [Russula brevipes]
MFRDEMVTVDRICSNLRHVVLIFDQISRTEEMVNNLLEINSQLDDIEETLAADWNDLLGPVLNLLRIVEAFDECLIELSRDILSFGVIVKIVKIVVVEEEDEKKLPASEPDATALLTLHAWLKEYKNGGHEQSLIDDYPKLIAKKLDEWIANLMKTGLNEFTLRSEQLELDRRAYRVTIDKRLNDAIDGCLDVATSSSTDLRPATKLLSDVSQPLASRAARARQLQFLVVYLTALVNTQKLRMPAAVERIKDDAEHAEACQGARVILRGCGDGSLAPRSIKELGVLVPDLCEARGDLDRSSVNEFMDSIKRKVKEENLTDPPAALNLR